MSIKISDIGLTESLRSVVGSVQSSTFHMIETVDANANDFEVEEEVYQVTLSVPCFGVRQMSAEQIRRVFGAQDEQIVRATLATPPYPHKFIKGAIGVIDFSNQTQSYAGIIQRTLPKLSSLWHVYINTSAKISLPSLGILLEEDWR